ncbi:hypothetical protein [Paractinoplanes atraurantiacus]|uniref:Uncharacterized protein n=1 Tax=Paractinoplanes atraurantiacus TaxID=1036182 RepID=A0A285IXE6_9ACTN|nr:hypothetical protein [Actinoplanes atraurantiacus]SNY52662.1 hypothetical protein SAMN05421748_11361 [Actinoplanes atraurantiacus]
MERQPTWLRGERSYRAYVRGLRYGLAGFLLAVVSGLLGRSGVIGHRVPVAGVAVGFVVAFGSVVSGVIGWLLVPDKNRANVRQAALLRMVVHDVVRGLPANR